MHDILGREAFTRLVDRHKTIKTEDMEGGIKNDEEEKKKEQLPKLGDEIPEEIEGEEDDDEFPAHDKLPGEEDHGSKQEAESRKISGPDAD
jgi:hypothetical protein